MPSINNIDKFVQFLNTLGDEPEVLEKRGQRIEPAVVPEKTAEETNPFLVNIEEDSAEDDPELIEEDLADDLFDSDLFDDDEAPELEVDENFSLDDLGDIESDELDEISVNDDFNFDDLVDTDEISSDEINLDELDDIDEISLDDTNLDELDQLDDIDEINSNDELNLDELDELDEIPADNDFDLDDLDEVSTDDNFDLDELDEITGDETPDIEDVSDIDDINFDDETDDLGDLEELGGHDDLSDLTDDDLDTSPDSLIDDIKDISLEDISIEDEDDDLISGFDSISIEDEVLEDDFGSLDDDDSDEFSLGDFGDSFNFDSSPTSNISLEEFTEAEGKEESEEEEERKYTQEEFESIKKCMNSLPLNLKIVIEEEIAENGLFGVKLTGLIELLIDNAPLKEILKYVNKKLGHNIKISNSFMKLSALDFEKQKQKFTYILFNIVFPKLKWVFPITIAASLIFIAVYFKVYKIVKSENIYKEGYELILIDKYEEAYDKFLEGFNTHRKMKWYYIFADTYHERKAFDFAERIYLQIVNERTNDLHGILSYAEMKGYDQGDYEKATHFLLDYADHGFRDYGLMATLGDLYLKWGEIDSSKFEDARLWYAETMNDYGPKPEILFKYLNYFIKTDNLKEVLTYRRMFEISTDVEVDGDIYARMAGYLMDKGIVDDVRATLFRGLENNPRNPNLHYQLAKYFKSIGNNREVEKAARNAIFYFEYGGELTAEELTSLVDTKRILGSLYSEDERYLAAEKNYKEAASLYENLLERNFVEKEERFGEIYAGYGDIFYYAGNSYSSAYNLFTKAEENGYTKPELSYKKGFINYQDGDMKDALLEFHQSETVADMREQVMFAKANTLAYRGSYSSALTYYNMHLRHLQKVEEEEETLYPGENEAHLAIIENYIRLYNNIGVVLYKMNGEKSLPEVGMSFTKSTEYYDYLTRDPELLVRSGLKDLAYYNTKAILYPDKDMELLLYNSISKDFSDYNLGIVSVLK